MTATRFFKLLIDYAKGISTCFNLICGKKVGLPSPQVIFFSFLLSLQTSILYFFEVPIAIVCFILTDLIMKQSAKPGILATLPFLFLSGAYLLDTVEPFLKLLRGTYG